MEEKKKQPSEKKVSSGAKKTASSVKNKKTTADAASGSGRRKNAETRKSGKEGGEQKTVGKKTSGRKAPVKKAGTGEKEGSTGREIDVLDISRKKGTPVFAEILLWITLAFCVILSLSNFFGICGPIGDAVSRFFFGIFGVMGYLFPVVLFLGAAFLVANRGSSVAWVRMAAGILLLVCLCTFCELLVNEYDAGTTVGDFYRTGAEWKTGGGAAGGLLCRALCPVFGVAGAWICTMVLLIIGIIMLTGRSLIDGINRNSRYTARNARVDSSMRREIHHLKKERSQLQRQKKMQNKIERMKAENEGLQLEVREPRRTKKVSGVSSNTTLDTSLPPSEEIHEVTPKVRTIRRQEMDIQDGAVLEERSAGYGSAGSQGDSETWEGAASGKRSSAGLEKSRARKMVDSVSAEKPAKQLDLNFTIQRNGVSEQIGKGCAFSAAELAMPEEETEASVTPEMPELKPMPEMNTNRPIRNPKSSKEEQEAVLEDVAAEIARAQEEEKPAYVFPPVELLARPSGGSSGNNNEEVKETAVKLQQTLHNFGVNVTVTNVSCGPAVTRYELMPEQGVKVSRIVNLSDDIKLNLAAADIRIEAPIPGKPAVGIEVPNKENSAVMLRELIESEEFKNAKSKLSFAVGKDIAGKVVVADIAKMPHLLIAGATGSGKSVCINTLIMSILYKADPEEVKLIMIDPKVVELSVYNGIPHLFIPVVTDPKKASGALNWGVAEMSDRYQKFAECGVRDLKGYNAKIDALKDVEDANKPKKLPQIVIIVDELADLMMVAPGEVEDAICRLAQLARAAGIHLIIATQRPSVNVITGLIKANMPSRIAFSVTSGVDSRTIIDMNGAEKLLGKGDMLFYPQGYQKPVRVQGAFVSDNEVSAVAEFLTGQNTGEDYKKDMEERISQVQQASASSSCLSASANEMDTNFVEAGKFIIEKEKASIGMLQRVFKIGFNRAARIMDQLSDAGVVGPEEGTKPRKVLMTMEEFEQYVDENL